ncbi:MAG TPA: peptidase T [Candidatus Dorea intestinavium]|nr:peptidase T [Candidatus Dorea intestinavium]
MTNLERLLKYVAIKTPSDENNDQVHPSSEVQFNLAKVLKEEMQELGLFDVYLDDTCYLYGKLPATKGLETKTPIGFIAHMDTVSTHVEAEINPLITKNYDGGELSLSDSGLVLSPKDFPHLPSLKGRTLITSDGHTILGVDDKAGIAEILTMIERLQKENIPHGPISVAFTPDEEIGTGAHGFDVKRFGAKYAYTLDGDTEGEIQYENFNACKAIFNVKGFDVHPGSSKDTMINAALVAMEINSLLPGCETPRGTEGYEGFYHLDGMSGNVGSATISYIVRDHDAHTFDARKKTLKLIEKNLNEKWGEGCVTLTIKDQYRNMSEIIADCMQLIENAKEAATKAGITPIISPIRGGTDGATLSFMGLPCPNLGTGGHAYHGPYEHTTVEGMDAATDMAIELVQLDF